MNTFPPLKSWSRLLILFLTGHLSVFSHSVMAQVFANASTSLAGYAEGTVAPQRDCSEMETLQLPDLVSIKATIIAADGDVPEHCRVDGVFDPEIVFQVNLPMLWNSRFYMVGNGGHAGQSPEDPVQVPLRNNALKHHFVMASTDTGHDSRKESGASFVMSNPQKAIDYAFRAVHLTAVNAKEIANYFYGQPVAYSYWDSCSNGGRQGMLEAQRYPQDFDGIVANAPWLDQTGFTIGALWNHRAMMQAVLDKQPITAGKMALVADKVMAKCDAVDGLEDGLIDDPRNCQFDVANDVPSCSADINDDSCLTTVQAQAIQNVYDGPHDSMGRKIFPGFALGSEAMVQGFGGSPASGWMNMIVPTIPGATADFGLAQQTMRYLVFNPPRPDYDYRDFDFDRDPELLHYWGRLADALDTDLSDFRQRGGKIIMMYGWADTILQPEMAVNYYERAVAANQPEPTDFIRLFMVPGMSHCFGGIGPDQMDAVTAVIDWVEHNKAPDSLLAKKIIDGDIARSRPLCPYPKVARYQGQGSIDAAENFACEAP